MTHTLLVDTNRAAYPIYQALCDLGHEVSVVGRSATETLAKVSPNYIALDYADTERLAALVAERGFDYLVPGCTDLSYSVCSGINPERYTGFDTPETTHRINHKEEFRRVAAGLGLSVPRVLSEAEAAGWPAVIVKPVDAFSGRGVRVLDHPGPEELAAALREARSASTSGRALVEEFVTGQLHSHSAFLRGGRILADFFVREDCTASPFAVDTSCVTDEVPAAIRVALREQVEALAAGLALVDGLVHTQFILRDDRFWIIEITRRCPGDLYALLIELSTGYPYATHYAAPFVGRAAQPIGPTGPRQRIIRHTVTARDGAALWGLRFARPVHIRLWVPLATAGDRIAPSPAGRAAIIFFCAPSTAEQDALYGELLAGTLYSFD